jgi:hypothetical protein
MQSSRVEVRSVEQRPDVAVQEVCPVCGAPVETKNIAGKAGWTCLVGGYAHYYQAQYGHLRKWFTSGQGNLREPVIRAMNCAA